MGTNQLTIKDLMRVSQVKRWHIEDIEPQTLADHTARVSLLVDHVYSKLRDAKPEEHLLALRWALYHDTPEILTGDPPTPFKNKLPPGFYKGFEDNSCNQWAELKKQIGYTRTLYVVKICDIIESWWYYRCKGKEKRVLDGLWDSATRLIDRSVADFPSHDWDPLKMLANQLCSSGYTQLEDVLRG